MAGFFSFHIGDMIGFTSAPLHPPLTGGFVISLSQQAFVEKVEVEICLQRLLVTMPVFCRLTNLVHIHAKQGENYIWVHPMVQPSGEPLPVQCSTCGCIRPWIGNGGEWFICKNPRCGNKLSLPVPSNVEWLRGEVSGGRWLVQHYLE